MRALYFFPPALLIVIALFLFMAQLAHPDKQYQADSRNSLSLNMHRMRLDSEVQLRERTLPPPPEPAPQTPSAQTPAINTPLPQIDMPPVDLPDVSFDSPFKIATNLPVVPALEKMTDVPNPLALDMSQVPLRRINPQYPRRALKRKVQGYVIVEFIVNNEGRVEPDSLVFIEANPEGIFERTVRRSVMKWRFNPLKRNGGPVRFKSRQRFEFKLDR